MDNSIIFPLSVFPMPIRNIVDSLHKYENYQMDFTASAFLTVFAATMGNTWSARFMTGWVSRPIIYMVLVGPPSCGKTPPLRQAISPLLKLDESYDRVYAKKSGSTVNGNGLLPDSASSNPCRKRWRRHSASAMWWSTLP